MNWKCMILVAILALSVVVAAPSDVVAYNNPSQVGLNTAGNFTILAETTITNVPTSSIVGDMGISPNAASSITGFSLVAAGSYLTSAQVTGKIYAADYSPAYVGTAVGDMLAAYNDAAGRSNDSFNLGAGTIFNQNLGRGVYKWTSPVTITTDLTLTGTASDVWIFQIDQTLDMAANMKVILVGGAQAENVFWQVAGHTTLLTGSDFAGTLLGAEYIALQHGATLDGRALSQTAVNLDGNTITSPVPEPCTMLLLGSGLVGLFAWRKKSRSAA